MADDDRIYRAAQKAAQKALADLGRARHGVTAARGSFGATPGLLSWGTLDDKIKKQKELAAQYRSVQEALRKAERAIADAERACTGLMSSTQR